MKKLLQEELSRRWDLFDAIPRIEITTTVWLKENLDPLAVYMAFPFAVQNPRIYYDSLGSTVEVGLIKCLALAGNVIPFSKE